MASRPIPDFVNQQREQTKPLQAPTSELLLRFILMSGVQLGICLSIFFGLKAWVGYLPPSDTLILPTAFQFGTALLLLGSWAMHQALHNIQLERQHEFRMCLSIAVISAVLFVGVQSHGLASFAHSIPRPVFQYGEQVMDGRFQGVHRFIMAFAALHAMHFIVAQSVLVWVTINGFANRYDHEYYWGVTFATWFWHVLGIVWIAILCVFSIAGSY